MTNQQIIFDAQIKLMKQGLIGTTGRMLMLIKEDGSQEVVPEPEPIHTYSAWKELGYQVLKGQKAIASIPIWKHTDAGMKKNKNSGEEVEIGEKMFKKMAYFYRQNQVVEFERNKGRG